MSKKREKSHYDEKVNVGLPKKVYDALDELSNDNGTSMGHEVRKAIVDRLKKKKKLEENERYL